MKKHLVRMSSFTGLCLISLALVSLQLVVADLSPSVLPLRGDWVRYRPDFADFALGYNGESASSLSGAPEAIFYPGNSEEVRWFAKFFHERFTFSVRSGGHSYEGLSTTPCSVTIDTSGLDSIRIDRGASGSSVTVGAGVRHAQLYETVAAQNLGVAGAKCHDVGFMGCTLGGCHGFLSAAYGLSSDNVQSLEVILANSSVITVSAKHHPQLFWALRGAGGGDFGVVTSVQVAARPLGTVFAYEFVWDLSGSNPVVIADIVEAWQDWAVHTLPANTSAFLNCTSTFVCTARGVYAGNDARFARQAATALMNRIGYDPESTVGDESYSEVASRWDECRLPEKLAHKVKSLYYPDPIRRSVLEQGIAVLQRAGSNLAHRAASITFSRVGFGEVDEGSAADLFHDSMFLAELSASWTLFASGEEARKANLDWIRQLHVAMSPGSRGAYRNFEDLDMGATWFTYQNPQNHPAAPYYTGEALAALEELKVAYDKESVFRNALTASFAAAEMESFHEMCQMREWPSGPELELDTVITQPPTQALFGYYVEWGSTTMQPGQLAAQARRLTHIVYAFIPARADGFNVTGDLADDLKAFVQTVKDANSGIKVLLSVGGGGTNETTWLKIARSPAQRNLFATSIRQMVDDFEVDGVDINWFYPGIHDKANFVSLLRAVRASLAPKHTLTIDGHVVRAVMDVAYEVKEIVSIVDYVLLIAYDFEHLEQGSELQWLTHFNANLFSANPTIGSAAGGVVNWIKAGAPREKLVLGIVTYGYAYDTVGPAPSSPGKLDWRVLRKTRAFTALSQDEGIAGWSELRDVLKSSWSTFRTEYVPALGGTASWSEELGVWVGYDSPESVAQKAAWARSMGLGGGMVWPLHMDTYKAGEDSLIEAYLTALEIEIDLDGWMVDVLTVSLACGLPVFFLACCVHAQLRRWHDIRKMHDGLAQVSFEPWTSKQHPLAQGPSNLEALEEGDGGGGDDMDWGRTPSVRSPVSRRRSSYARMSDMVAGPLRALRRASQASAARRSSVRTPSNRKRASILSATGSFRSMGSVQSAFDNAMRQGASSDFDDVMSAYSRARRELSGEDAALAKLPDRDLQRKLSLLKKTNPDRNNRYLPEHLQKEDGYASQHGVVRYSRLLRRDAHDWLENCDTDYLAFYETKQRGLIKLMVVVTMYAETPDLLERSLRGVAHGIHQLATETAFLRAWDEAVVCIVADGLAKLPEETKDWLEQVGLFAPSLIDDAKKLDEALEGEAPDVALHCFEGLLQFEDWCPVQTVVLIKQENAGKLDSQRWAFTGLGERLMPVMPERLRQSAEHDDDQRNNLDNLTFDELRALDRYLITVDAGTKPLKDSLVELIMPMRYDPRLAGTCGHMVPDRTIGNLLVQSQVFEYEHGHIIDKSMEAMFGFITVLPGAYSGYRFDAIRRDQWIKGKYRRQGPLCEYFKQLTTPADSPALLNMGLAEDRWLCFSLMSQEGKSNALWYARRAGAVTDVPDTLQTFLQQRRRWNNGAFFTRLYVMRHYLLIFQGTKHSLFRQVGFMIQLATMLFDTIFVWFAAAFFYLWITYNVEQIGSRTIANAMGPSFLILYLLAVVAHYDRRVAEIKWVHRIIAYTLGCEILFCIGVFVYDQTRNTNWQVTVLVTFSLACSLFMSLLQGKFIKVAAMLVGYLLLYPTYAVLAQLYGFCHVHDVSWGTKGIETTHGEKKGREKEEQVRLALSSFRFRILVAFIVSNFVFGYVVGFFNQQQNVLLPLFLVIVFFNVIRALGSFAFTIVNWIDDALQITALGTPVREFGSEYDHLQDQVQRINAIDVRTSHKVYRLIRRRCREQQIKRNEIARHNLAITPAPLQLDNVFEEGGMSPTASSSEGIDNIGPVQPGAVPPMMTAEVEIQPEQRRSSTVFGSMKRPGSFGVEKRASVRAAASQVRYLDQLNRQDRASAPEPEEAGPFYPSDRPNMVTPPPTAATAATAGVVSEAVGRLTGAGRQSSPPRQPADDASEVRPGSPYSVEVYSQEPRPANAPWETPRPPGILRTMSQ